MGIGTPQQRPVLTSTFQHFRLSEIPVSRCRKSRYLVPFKSTQRAAADLTGAALSQTWICKITHLLCYVPGWCYVSVYRLVIE